MILLLCCTSLTKAFLPLHPIVLHTYKAPLLIAPLSLNKREYSQNDERKGIDDKETYYLDTNSDNKISAEEQNINELDDLTPPTINIARDSILFSENPSTKRNNAFLNVWISCKNNLPPIITGAWPWRIKQRRSEASQDNVVVYAADENPLGAMYNMAFVRIPVIGIAIVYCYNLSHGHPLIMDLGQGTFEVSPLIVLSVLAFILA